MTKTKVKWPIIFRLYQIIIATLALFAPLILSNRVKKGKDLAQFQNDRFGKLRDFEQSEKTLIWFHAASVGETMIGLNIANALNNITPNLQFLFSAQTIAAYEVFKKANIENAIFRFAPFDTPKITKLFLKNYAPKLAIFIEGEIWPNLLYNCDKFGIKRILINARMTDKSIKNWTKNQKLAKAIFSNFKFIHAASDKTKAAIENILGENIALKGNLKLNAPALRTDQEIINQVKSQTQNRKIWLCASSHEGEEEIIIDAHSKILLQFPDALLIIAPRHLVRTEAIFELAQTCDLNSIAKTQNELITSQTKIYIWNTLGELGSAFKIADCAFIAGSLLPKIGGHNPVEPAKLDCPMLSGPFYHNFADIFEELKLANGAIITKDANADEIAKSIISLFSNPDECTNLVKNANSYIHQNDNIEAQTIKAIEGLI
jgi:3-deoxy-D-manno-octulosonic-acid transferase